jgi:CheY-like chemotaxis protein
VLIVDDHAVIRRMFREVCEAEHLEVSEAENGAEAVQRAQDLNPQVIVLDLSMPVMNGLDAARELTVLMPHVPLLMLTNNAIGALESETRSAGISAVFCKANAGALKQALAHILLLLRVDEAGIPRAS